MEQTEFKNPRKIAAKTTALLALAAALFLGSKTTASADEFRGLWVDAFGSGFLSSNEVSQLVADCKNYNFNAVVVEMRRRGDAFYVPHAPNQDPKTTAIASNFDALGELIKQCHQSNPRIEVHCWAVANLIWSGTSAPTQAGHVYNTHPEYLTKTSGGSTSFSEGYFLDPGHPDAMQWNYNMAKDIVSHYDIDGFHWDYIRYPQQDAGYNATAIARYNAEFGTTGQPSMSSSQFSTWRRRQVTDFIRWANADLLEIKPSLIISAAVFANRTDAFSFRFQDWSAWSQEGLLDVFMPMNYSADNATFNSRVDDAFSHQGIRRCYMGQGAYLNTKENTLTQLQYVRSKPLSGSLVYSYRTPNSGTVNQDATLQYIKDNFQPTWEATPALPWVASPTTAIIKGTVVNQNTGDALYNANVKITGRSQLTEPHGKYAFYEVPVGSYTVTASYAGVTSAPVAITATAGGIFNANLSINLPLAPDTTAPVISAVTISGLSSNSVTIKWTTDENADGQVEYGTTANYGSTALNGTDVTSHSVTLSGLDPMTSYNYRVTSQDPAGNTATSGNFQFTTMPANSDIIVDNPSASVTGTWSTASSSTDRFGADYRFKSRGTGTAFLKYTPNIPVNGNYQVFEMHPAGSNRPTNAPVVVTSAAGTQTVSINQQVVGGKWVYVGTFNFLAGTSGNVKITDGFTGPTNGVVMADAVRFVYVPDGISSDVIVDNPAAVLTGTWTLASSSADRFGADYRFKSRGTTTTNTATFTPTLTVAGSYQVFEMHPAGSNRGQNVPHTVTFGNGTQTQTILVNQQGNGGKWNLLGTFDFNTNTTANVKIADNFATPTNGVVMADAIRFVFVAPTPAPTEPSNISAQALSASSIQVDWADNSDNESNFVIARSTTAGGPYMEIATLAANTTSYVNAGLEDHTTYYYVVRATGTTGTSENSAEASATTLQLPPAAPTILAATPASASQIDLRWVDNDGSSDLTFIVGRSSSQTGPFEDVAFVPPQVVNYSDTGLTPSTTYYYRVRAQNAGGDSANSNVAGATTFSSAPTAPIGVAAIALSSSAIDFSWNASSTDADSFVVSRSTGLGTLVDIATLPVSASIYHDTGLAAHTMYFYSVRAVNVGGSASSAVANATTHNNAPTAGASAPQTVSANSNCEGSVTLDGSSSTDPDGDSLSYLWSGLFGNATGVSPTVTLPVGTSVVTLTVNDGHGGSSSTSINVTVADTTAPTITLVGANPFLVQCASFFADPGATAFDSCSGDLTGSINVSSDVNPYVVGDYTATYNVMYQSGNQTTVTRIIRVIDTLPPVVNLVGSNPMTIEANDPFVDPGITACDICDPNLTTTVAGTVDTTVLGTYVLTYTAADPSGNSATVSRTVNVVDTIAPVLTLNGHSSSTIECHSSYVEEGATAIDAFAGDLTSSIAIYGTVDPNTPGIYTVTYSVTDPSGNTVGAERTIYVVDTTAPALTLNGASSMTVEANSSFVDPGASATDVCAGDLTSAITISGTVDTTVLGEYTLTYQVADVSGNQATATRVVKVVDTTAPSITLDGPNFMTVECHSAFRAPGATASDKVSGDISSSIVVTGNVDANVPGTYTLTYTATDASGNSSSATRTVQVSDTTAPEISAIAASPNVLNVPNHTVVAVTISVSATDGCDNAITSQILSVKCNQLVNTTGDGNTSDDWQITGPLTLNLRAERAGNLGDRIYTVTVQTVDASGNVSTKNVAVTVPHDQAKK